MAVDVTVAVGVLVAVAVPEPMDVGVGVVVCAEVGCAVAVDVGLSSMVGVAGSGVLDGGTRVNVGGTDTGAVVAVSSGALVGEARMLVCVALA